MNQELINKKKKIWIQNKYDLRVKENYEPWLSEREFSGQGALIILKSCLFERNYVVFSKLQEMVLLQLLYQDNIVDIREHYPIFSTGDDKVICTTFLISRRNENGQVIDEAISAIKTINQANKKRISFQMEFWENRGITYKVVTETDLIGQENHIYNYKLLYPLRCNRMKYETDKENPLCKEIIEQITRYDGEIRIDKLIDNTEGQERFKKIEWIKILVAHGVVEMDWSKKFTCQSEVWIKEDKS